jgi:biotin transport system substrate-specific component
MKTTESTKRIPTRALVYVALMAVVIAACAWLQIPFGQINFTMQTFGVFMAVGLLGGKLGTLSVVVYLLIGAFGAPVFTNFTGGIAKLAGPTGGYLVGFIFAALVYWGVTKLFGDGPVPAITGMILGNLVCYAFGTAWFMVVASSKPGLAAALSMCVLPYIVPDLCKIALAYVVTLILRDRLRAQHVL